MLRYWDIVSIPQDGVFVPRGRHLDPTSTATTGIAGHVTPSFLFLFPNKTMKLQDGLRVNFQERAFMAFWSQFKSLHMMGASNYEPKENME